MRSGTPPRRSTPSPPRSRAYRRRDPPRGDDDFPERLRAERPDIVFNIAEGLHGANREAHVPAICEFFGIPYSGSDPFTLSLCLDKARTKEILARPRRPDRALRARRIRERPRDARRDRRSRALDVSRCLRQAGARGIVEGNHRAELRPRRATSSKRRRAFLLETLRPAGDRRGLPPRRRVHLRRSRQRRRRARAADRRDELRRRSPTGALPIYGFEAKWIWDRPERSARHLRVPGAHRRRAPSRDRGRRAPRLSRARLPRLVAHRRAARRRTACRTSSR